MKRRLGRICDGWLHVRRLVLAMTGALLVSTVTASTAGAYVYWVGGGVSTASLEGDNIQTLVGAVPGGIGNALVVSGSYIYGFDQSASGSYGIARANVDGTGLDPNFITGITSTDPPLSLAVEGNYIYFNYDDFHGNYSIGRANLDGSGLQMPFIQLSGLSESAYEIAADSNYIYWVNFYSGSTGQIGRANLDGTAIDESFIQPAHPTGLAVDQSHIYWSDPTGFGRANLDGTGVDNNFISLSWPGGATHSLTTDGSYLYWSAGDQGSYSGPGYIGRANLDGTGVNTSFIPLSYTPGPVQVDGGLTGTSSTSDVSCSRTSYQWAQGYGFVSQSSKGTWGGGDSPTTCTATVTGSGGSGGAPTGPLAFTDNSGNSTTCALQPTSATQSSCAVTIDVADPVPGPDGSYPATTSVQVSASYGGDTPHRASSGSVPATITISQLSCQPSDPNHPYTSGFTCEAPNSGGNGRPAGGAGGGGAGGRGSGGGAKSRSSATVSVAGGSITFGGPSKCTANHRAAIVKLTFRASHGTAESLVKVYRVSFAYGSKHVLKRKPPFVVAVQLSGPHRARKWITALAYIQLRSGKFATRLLRISLEVC